MPDVEHGGGTVDAVNSTADSQGEDEILSPSQVRAFAQFRSAATEARGSCVEAVARDRFSTFLGSGFPVDEPFVRAHASGSETHLPGEGGSRFADVVIGLTTIEYEKDLRNTGVYATGFGQAREQAARLIAIHPEDQEKVVAILSDTVRWEAYRASVGADPSKADLASIGTCDLSDASCTDEDFASFLRRFLSTSALALTPGDINADFGLSSPVGTRSVASIESASGLGYTEAATGYLVTLASLISYFVLSGAWVRLSDADLERVITGEAFQGDFGLENFVDVSAPLINQAATGQLLQLAAELQETLRSYDFSSVPADDLFSGLMVELADKTQRLYLGQAATPTWLARTCAIAVLDRTSASEGTPRIIDPCSGTATILREVIVEEVRRHPGRDPHETLATVLSMVLGFDIDPLPVLLGKLNIAMAVRDVLAACGNPPIHIPLYEANSLAPQAPLGQQVGPLHHLPHVLRTVGGGQAFDVLVSRSCALTPATTTDADIAALAEMLVDEPAFSGLSLSDGEVAAACREVVDLAVQHGAGPTSFHLRNTERPYMLEHAFGTIVSNPPWLTPSKAPDWPQAAVAEDLARTLNIQPTGAAWPHTELATVFVVAMSQTYLSQDGTALFIVPDAVKSAMNHERFRQLRFRAAGVPTFCPIEMWQVDHATFANTAIVLIGQVDDAPVVADQLTLSGFAVAEGSKVPTAVAVSTRGGGTTRRVVWVFGQGQQLATYSSKGFRQGCDLMPRTVYRHVVGRSSGRKVRIEPLPSAGAPILALAKKAIGLRCAAGYVHRRYCVDGVTSMSVLPLFCQQVETVVAPFRFDGASRLWRSATGAELRVDGSEMFFTALLNRMDTNSDLATAGPWTVTKVFDLAQTPLRKLEAQTFPDDSFVVILGRSGGVPTACWWPSGADGLPSPTKPGEFIVDQTVQWSAVSTQDEALYMAGMLSSPACRDAIKDFQSSGLFSERHVDSLAPTAFPDFLPGDSDHAAVVAATRDLTAAMMAAGFTGGLPVPTPSTLSARRRTVKEGLESLPEWDAYVVATRCVFGVADETPDAPEGTEDPAVD